MKKTTSKVYVGNLPYTSIKEDIEDLFKDQGNIHSIDVIMNPETGQPRGFALVEMDSDQARQAVSNLHHQEYEGRTLYLNERT